MKLLFRRTLLRNPENLGEVVQVNYESGAVQGGGEGADKHEKPVEAVGAGEEAGERNGGGRRLNLVGLLHLLLDLHGLRRGGLGTEVEVRRRRFRRLGHLGDRRERLYMRRGPPEQSPRNHHLRSHKLTRREEEMENRSQANSELSFFC